MARNLERCIILSSLCFLNVVVSSAFLVLGTAIVTPDTPTTAALQSRKPNVIIIPVYRRPTYYLNYCKLSRLTSANPWIKIQPYLKPSPNNLTIEKQIFQLGGLKALRRPFGNIITDFIMKKRFDNKENINYKISSTRPSISVLENVLEENRSFNPTIKLDVNIHSDKIPLGGVPVSNSFPHYKQFQINETTQRPIDMNQFDKTTDPQNETDNSRQLDYGSEEEEEEEEDNNEVDDPRERFSTAAKTDKSFLIHEQELIKRLISNHPQGSKLYRIFKKQSTVFPKSVNINGKNCTMVVEKNQGGINVMVNCDEKSFDDKNKQKTTTYKSNVTFYTDELPDTTTEPVQQLIDEDMNNSLEMFITN